MTDTMGMDGELESDGVKRQAREREEVTWNSMLQSINLDLVVQDEQTRPTRQTRQTSTNTHSSRHRQQQKGADKARLARLAARV